MNIPRTIFASLALLALVGVASVRADLSNTWTFSTPTDYQVSNADEIEVADGVAKLKLLPTRLSVADLDSYLTTNATWTTGSFGPDVLLTLARSGGGYVSHGEYTSRIFDGGLGNRWDSFSTVAYNNNLLNAGGELVSTASNLIFLAHFNNSWVNEVGGDFGVASAGSSFSEIAKLSSHAAYFSSLPDVVSYSMPFSGQKFTAAFWINMPNVRATSAQHAIYFSNSGSYVGGIEVGGLNTPSYGADNIEFIVFNRVLARSMSGTYGIGENNRWVHVAVVFDGTRSSDDNVRIFKNGVRLQNDPARQQQGTVLTFNQFTVGGRGYQGIVGLMDEVAVFDAALTDTDIFNLYRSPQSMLFQCRSGATPEVLENREFVGPSGTDATFYSVVDPNLNNSLDFSRVDRLIQYKLTLIGQTDGAETPLVDSVGIVGSRVSAFDNVLGDFQRGGSLANIEIFPEETERSHIALSRQNNGGYPAAGSFTSRVLDAGTPVFWDELNWDSPKEITSVSDLIMLWHVNGGWADATGNGVNGQLPQNIVFTTNAKLGSQSAVFNGSTSEVTANIHLPVTNSVGAVQFWVNTKSYDDGLFDFGAGRTISMRSRLIVASGFGGDAPEVYVNGTPNSRQLRPGWNHVAVVFPSTFNGTQALVIGRAGTDYFEGLLDEIALHRVPIDGGTVKSQYLRGGGAAAGNVRFQVRASNTFRIPDSLNFIGPGNSPTAYFTSTGAPLPSEVWGKRYFQYRAYLEGDGEASPAVYQVSVDYSGAIVGRDADVTPDDFAQGTFSEGNTAFSGTDMATYDNSVVPGLVNIDPVNELSLAGLWHMDEGTWAAGSSVLDSSGNGLDGDPQNGPYPAADAKVGAACAKFSGASQYLILPSINLASEFSIGAWFRTAASARTAVASRSDGSFFLEINGDGNAASAGAAAFVLNRTSRVVVSSPVTVLNDGGWHHIAGVRKGLGAYLYIDGVRVASAVLPSNFGAMGLGQHEVARHPETGGYLNGSVDELFIYSRALSDAEMTEKIAAGRSIKQDLEYVSTVYDAGGPAIWESLSWVENGTFGEAQSADALELLGLWHMDSVSGGGLVDESASGFDANLFGSYTAGSGVFSGALALGGSGYAQVSDSPVLEPDSISVSIWVNMTELDNRAILDKRNGGTGYALYTDAAARPVFWVGGVECIGAAGVRPGEWTQITGTYDGRTIRLYLNGRVAGAVTNPGASLTGNALQIGQSGAGPQPFIGLLDELLIQGGALNQEEVADLARAGLGYIRFQARAGNSPDLSAVGFVGPDGTSSTFFTIASESPMIGSVPLGRYFQFRMELSPVDGLLAPVFQGATIKQSRYSGDNPQVGPVVAKGVPFLGRILKMSHVMATNVESSVRYQISGDTTNWFYWSGAGWDQDALDAGWVAANEMSEINANINSFYDQHYAKKGGTFYFKAFLHSEGNDQTAIDQVSIGYSVGRITVLSPNGTERDQRAWLVDTPYTITWESAGPNSNLLRIQYSRDGGQTWVLIAENQADDGIYQGWVTPQAPSTKMLVRITDQNDASITDQSDATFHLVDIFQVKVPNGGERWYLTDTTNTVKWISPGPAAARGGQVDIRYASDGVNFNFVVKTFAPNVQGSSDNMYVWYATPGVFPTPLPSKTGKIRVHAADNTDPNFNGQDDSDAVFTLAGITVVNPGEGSYINNGKDVDLTWVSALGGAKVAVDFSRDNGGTWTNVLASINNVDGVNHYPWLVNLEPSDTARIRIRSLTDNKIWGISGVFQLADIKVTYPRPGESWELRQNNTIRWESGGAGDRVDLYYSLDSGGTWTTIKSNVVNVTSNAYIWTVAPFPSEHSSIRVVAHADRENLRDETDDFNIAGVRVAFPQGGEVWPMNGTDAIRWEFADAGSEGAIYVSLNGGVSWDYLGARGLGNFQINWRPLYPSVRALAKIEAVNPPDWAVDMTDQSDAYFTVGGVKVLSPTNSQLLTIGQQGSISWVSAGSLQVASNEFAYLYYTADGGVTSNQIAVVGNNENYPGVNAYVWNIPGSLPPSESARVIVAAPPYRGLSDPFTLRGMRFTRPNEGEVVDIGGQLDIQWDYAGLNASAGGFIFLSSDGGATFSGAAINATRVSVPGGVYGWNVPSNSVPSTNAVLKFVVDSSTAPEDIGYEVKSQPFIMRGLKIMAPGLGSVLPHASANQIHLVASRAGDFASIYYSPDGTNYDATPVVRNYPFKDGSTFIPWTVEKTRLPSASARIKAVSTIATTVSEPFTVEGVKVLRPLSTDIWAAGEATTIRWKGQGTAGSYTITVENGGASVTVASGYAGSSITWVADASLAGTGVVVRVRDSGGYEGVSDPFRIVAQPTVIVTTPADGNYWRVSDTYSITWSRGGQMTNDFTVSYASEPYSDWTEISGSPAFDDESNSFSMPWTVPDLLGLTRIRVQHNTVPSISDESPSFYIVGKFEMIFPNGGEQTLYARKPATLSWYTWGSVGFVNLYYSVDPLHEAGSWVQINDAPVPNPGRDTEPSTYQWEVVDLGGSLQTVRVRVEQADRPGAYDDSNADFPVKYYTITWFVVDEETGENLNNLSVTESHGKSDSDLLAPVVRKYPWGFFDTVWSREFFYDNVQFNWKSEPSRSIQVIMKRSDVDPDYNVFADFTYKGGSNDVLQIYTWLERAGATLPGPDSCVIHIYDENGANVTQLTANQTLLESGVFKFSWQNVTDTLTRGETYFAKVDIKYSGETYSSVITYSLRLTAEETDTANLSDDLAALSDAQANFRSSTTAALGNLLTNTSAIAEGVASLETNILAAVVPALGAISNEIMTVISPTLSNTWAAVSTFEGQIDAATARILTRDTTIAQGSPLTVLYKTSPGYGNGAVVFEVRTSAGADLGVSRKMNETVPGIYQYELTGAETDALSLGYYMLVCRDPGDQARDSTTMRIVAEDLYNAPVMLAAMSNDLAQMTVDLSNMAVTLEAVTNAATQLEELIDQLSALTNLDALATAIQDFPVDSLTNIVALSDKIDAIGADVVVVKDSIGSLTNLSEIATRLEQLNLDALTNITDLSSDVAAINSTVENIQFYSLGMSNEVLALRTQLTDQMGTLTNIDANVTDIQGALGALTNMDAIVEAIGKLNVDALTNINAVAEDIAALQIMVTNMSSDVSLLPEISARVITIEGTVSNLTSLSASVDALLPALAYITNAVGGISTNLADVSGMLATVNGLEVSMSSLTNRVLDLSTAVDGMSTNMAAARAELAYVAGAVTNLSALSGTNLANLADSLAGVTNSFAGVADTLDAVSNKVQETSEGLDSLLGSVRTPALSTTNGATERILYRSLPGAAAGEVVLKMTDAAGRSVRLNGATTSPMREVSGAPGIYEYALNVPDNLAKATYYVTVEDARTRDSADTTLLEVVESTDSATGAALTRWTSVIEGLVARLDAIDSELSVIGSDASDAASKSQQAKTQAADAATGVAGLQEALESGDLARVLPAVQNMMELLEAAKANVDEIPELVGPDRYHDQMLQMAGIIEEMADRRGFKDFLQLEPVDSVGGKGEAEAGADKESIGALSRNLEEMRSSMNLMQKLMDEKLYEPIVQETLLGVE